MLNAEDFILLGGRPEKWDEEVLQRAGRSGGQNARINLPELQEEQRDSGRRSVAVVNHA